MKRKLLGELVVIVLIVRICTGWRFRAHIWNRAHDDVYLNIHEIQLDSCLNECVLRPWCVAVQYHRIRRSCGILSEPQASTPMHIWKNSMYIKRSAMEIAASCDKGRIKDSTGTCITECSVPTNPRLYSDILGVPLVGRHVKITCHSKFTQDGDRTVRCSEDGQFDSLPTCQISGEVNVALNRPAWMSSTYIWTDAALAVDGNRDPYFLGRACIHTSPAEETTGRHWWLVDLGHIFRVASVVVYNRMDCCGFRFKNVYILVSMEKSLDATLDGELCAHEAGPFPQPVITFTCLGDARGRYLKIVLINSPYLHVCEVEVFVSTTENA